MTDKENSQIINLTEEESKKDLVSLKAFVDDYQKTFAVIGIFIVLGLFWKNFSHISSPYISFLCFLITIPLFWEIARSFKQENSSWNLVVFFYLFQGIFISSGLTFLFSYPKEMTRLLDGIIFIGLMFLSAKLIDTIVDFLHGRDVLDANKRLSKLEKAGVPVENRKEHAQLLQKQVNRSHFINKIFGGIFLVLLILVSLVLSLLAGDFMRATIDVLSDKSEITVPPPL